MINVLVWIVELFRSFSNLIFKVHSCTKWRRDFSVLDLGKYRFISDREWYNDISIWYHFLSPPISYNYLIVHLVSRWVSPLLSGNLHIEIIAWLLDYQWFTSRFQPTAHYLIVLIGSAKCAIIAGIRWLIKVIIIVSNFVKVNRHYTAILIINIWFEI